MSESVIARRSGVNAARTPSSRSLTDAMGLPPLRTFVRSCVRADGHRRTTTLGMTGRVVNVSTIRLPVGLLVGRTGAGLIVEGRGEQLGQMEAADAGQMVELGAAGEAVGQCDRVVSGSTGVPDGLPYGGQQRGLGHRHRDLVMPALDAEVARETAATADRPYVGARPGEQVAIGVPAHHRVVVAVRLRDRA